MGTFKLIAEVIMTLLFSAAAIWGITVSFKKRGVLFLQIVACGLGCMALGNIFILALNVTAPEDVLGGLANGFNVGLLGFFGMFAFLFSASYGQIDGLGDDKSKELRKYRLLALIAPAVTVLIFLAGLFTSATVEMLIVYGVLFVPAVLASYYNLKHLIIPDVEFGILSSIRKYNFVVLLMTVLVLLTVATKMFEEWLFYGILSILAGLSSVVVIYFAKKGAEGWLK